MALFFSARVSRCLDADGGRGRPPHSTVDALEFVDSSRDSSDDGGNGSSKRRRVVSSDEISREQQRQLELCARARSCLPTTRRRVDVTASRRSGESAMRRPARARRRLHPASGGPFRSACGTARACRRLARPLACRARARLPPPIQCWSVRLVVLACLPSFSSSPRPPPPQPPSPPSPPSSSSRPPTHDDTSSTAADASAARRAARSPFYVVRSPTLVVVCTATAAARRAAFACSAARSHSKSKRRFQTCRSEA